MVAPCSCHRASRAGEGRGLAERAGAATDPFDVLCVRSDTKASLLERFQERNQVLDLVRVQPELRHARMPRDNPLGQ